MIGPVWSQAGPGVFWVFVNNFNGENRDDLHRQKLTHCDWSSVLTCSGELHFRPDLGRRNMTNGSQSEDRDGILRRAQTPYQHTRRE